MKFNIVLLIIATLLVVDAEDVIGQSDALKRNLRKGSSSSRSSYRAPSSSSYRAPSSSSSSGYKKTTTTTYKKTYIPSRTSYTGSFSSGRSYAVLYVYYLPPNYYTAIGYYSPLYL